VYKITSPGTPFRTRGSSHLLAPASEQGRLRRVEWGQQSRPPPRRPPSSGRGGGWRAERGAGGGFPRYPNPTTAPTPERNLVTEPHPTHGLDITPGIRAGSRFRCTDLRSRSAFISLTESDLDRDPGESVRYEFSLGLSPSRPPPPTAWVPPASGPRASIPSVPGPALAPAFASVPARPAPRCLSAARPAPRCLSAAPPGAALPQCRTWSRCRPPRGATRSLPGRAAPKRGWPCGSPPTSRKTGSAAVERGPC